MSKQRRNIVGTILGSALLALLLGIGSIVSVAMGADDEVTMTAFVEDATAKSAAENGAVVTISSLEEFRLFQNELNESANGLSGLSFRQKADIAPGDYHYAYDRDMDRILVYQGDTVVACVGRDGGLYRKNGSSVSSAEELGFSELFPKTWDHCCWFRGNYDGGGYFVKGLIIGTVDGKGSSYGGLFCNLGEGSIVNLNVSDCCVVGCMSPLVNTINAGGEISNCHVSNIVGANCCFGGIAGIFWEGSIQKCTVENSVHMYSEGYSEGNVYGGLGGIVGMIEQTSGALIEDCEVKDAVIYGADYSQNGSGGIAGVAYNSRVKNVLIKNCEATVTICDSRNAGGVIGKVQKDGYASSDASFVISGCKSHGTIVENLTSSGSDFGGIVGKLDTGVPDFRIEQCVSDMTIEKLSAQKRIWGTAGGMIGSAKEYFSLEDTYFTGTIFQAESGEHSILAGGAVGEIAAGATVVNCANFGKINIKSDIESYCGGLIGLVSSERDVWIINNINVGEVTGKIAGGLVGSIETGSTSCYIQNDLSLGKVTGETLGSLTGEIHQGEITYCYWYNNGTVSSGNEYNGIQNCMKVTSSQLAGTETVCPIFDTGNYQGICEVKEVMNRQANLAVNRKSCSSWENTVAGYPFFEGKASTLSFTLPQLPAQEAESLPPTESSPPTGETGISENNILTTYGFQVKSINNKRVRLKWKKNTSVNGYIIYRSARKSSGYKILAKCSALKTKYADKTCKPGKKYYYRIRAYVRENGAIRQGKGVTMGVKLPWLTTPVYQMSRIQGSQGEKYLQISMKKYQGEYVDIYLKKQGQEFVKVSMKSHKISVYRDKIRFVYSKSGMKYQCKMRTYRIRKGKKQYSGYSAVKQITL